MQTIPLTKEKLTKKWQDKRFTSKEPIPGTKVSQEKEKTVEEPIIDYTQVENTIVEESVIENNVGEEPIINNTIEEPIIENNIEESVVENNYVFEPQVENTVVEEDKVLENPIINNEIIDEEPILENPIIPNFEETKVEIPITENTQVFGETSVGIPIVENPTIKDPVYEEDSIVDKQEEDEEEIPNRYYDEDDEEDDFIDEAGLEKTLFDIFSDLKKDNVIYNSYQEALIAENNLFTFGGNVLSEAEKVNDELIKIRNYIALHNLDLDTDYLENKIKIINNYNQNSNNSDYAKMYLFLLEREMFPELSTSFKTIEYLYQNKNKEKDNYEKELNRIFALVTEQYDSDFGENIVS